MSFIMNHHHLIQPHHIQALTHIHTHIHTHTQHMEARADSRYLWCGGKSRKEGTPLGTYPDYVGKAEHTKFRGILIDKTGRAAFDHLLPGLLPDVDKARIPSLELEQIWVVKEDHVLNIMAGAVAGAMIVEDTDISYLHVQLAHIVKKGTGGLLFHVVDHSRTVSMNEKEGGDKDEEEHHKTF